MPEEIAVITAVIEKSYEGDYRSVIRGNHGKFAESWTMWESHWGESPTKALQKATRLLTDMATDFLHAVQHHLPMNKEHPKVAQAK